MKPSFTILELVIVIIIIAILASTISIYIPNNNLRLAADNLAKNIRFAESLALKDDKYQPFPDDNTSVEYNRSKYWFKQWWQVRFTQNKNDPKDLWYEVFSDLPDYNATNKDPERYNFDRTAYQPKNKRDKSIAKDTLTGKYLIGKCGGSYPDCNKVDEKLNLTKKYGIKEVLFDGNIIVWNRPKRVMFDNYGNVFLNEGLKGDGGDINPLDKDNRNILTKNVNIKLCLDSPCNYNKNRCIQVNITPTGYIYTTECN